MNKKKIIGEVVQDEIQFAEAEKDRENREKNSSISSKQLQSEWRSKVDQLKEKKAEEMGRKGQGRERNGREGNGREKYVPISAAALSFSSYLPNNAVRTALLLPPF